MSARIPFGSSFISSQTINGTGLIEWVVHGSPFFSSNIMSAFPWSDVIIRVISFFLHAIYNFPKHSSTTSTAFTVASNTRRLIMSGLRFVNTVVFSIILLINSLVFCRHFLSCFNSRWWTRIYPSKNYPKPPQKYVTCMYFSLVT